MSIEHAAVDLIRQSLVEDRPIYLSVTSDSMAPLLRKGDEVGICGRAIDELIPGDVIALVDMGTLLIHRYWGLRESGGERVLVTRGDRLMVFDQAHPLQAYVGVACARRRDQRILPLAKGVGRRLNRILTRLIELEIRLINGGRPGLYTGTKPRGSFGGQFAYFVHRLIYFSSLIVTWTVHQILRPTPQA